MKKIWSIIALVLIAAMAHAQGTDCGVARDYDGNAYATVRLGNQCWMRENLRVTHFPDGTPLRPGTTTDTTKTTYFFPDNDSTLTFRFGLLYSWHTVMHGSPASEDVPSGVQSLCPDGWHLPSNFEWMGLEDFLGYKDEYRCGTDVNNVAKCMASQTMWRAPEAGVAGVAETGAPCSITEEPATNNASGMSVLPAGMFFRTPAGFGEQACFWTASEGGTETSPIHFFYITNAIVEINCTPKEAACSVRCVKIVDSEQ